MSTNKRDKYLEEGYRRIFREEPLPEMNDWQIAALVMEGLDPRPQVMGSKLAKQCIFRVFNYLSIDGFPLDLVSSVWLLAEDNARQFFWPDLPEEVSSGDMMFLEYQESDDFWSSMDD